MGGPFRAGRTIVPRTAAREVGVAAAMESREEKEAQVMGREQAPAAP